MIQVFALPCSQSGPTEYHSLNQKSRDIVYMTSRFVSVLDLRNTYCEWYVDIFKNVSNNNVVICPPFPISFCISISSSCFGKHCGTVGPTVLSRSSLHLLCKIFDLQGYDSCMQVFILYLVLLSIEVNVSNSLNFRAFHKQTENKTIVCFQQRGVCLLIQNDCLR